MKLTSIFNQTFFKEASCSKQVPKEQSNNKTHDESSDLKENTENMIVEFTSNDVFGDMD